VALMVLTGLAALVVGAFTVLLNSGAAGGSGGTAVPWGIAVAGWVLTVILALPVVLLWRRRH
jgi:hypothetical protein